jgi:hypothetical protein
MLNTSRGLFKRAGLTRLFTTLAGVTVCGLMFFASTGAARVKAPAPATPCDAIKGKTYIAFITGQFDDHPDAASAVKWIFDRQAKATGRNLYAYKPGVLPAQQQMPTATCAVGQDGVGLLGFKTGLSDAGAVRFWVYDNGARLWIEHTTPGRPMRGWYMQLPPPPIRLPSK